MLILGFIGGRSSVKLKKIELVLEFYVITMKMILVLNQIDTIDIVHYWPNFISYLPSVINVMKRNKKIPKNIDIANNAIIATVISMHFPIFVFSSRIIFCLFRSKWFARLLEAHRYCVSSAAWKKILQYHKSNLIPIIIWIFQTA